MKFIHIFCTVLLISCISLRGMGTPSTDGIRTLARLTATIQVMPSSLEQFTHGGVRGASSALPGLPSRKTVALTALAIGGGIVLFPLLNHLRKYYTRRWFPLAPEPQYEGA